MQHLKVEKNHLKIVLRESILKISSDDMKMNELEI